MTNEPIDRITAAEYRIAARVADAEGDLYLSEVLEQRAANAPAFTGSTDPIDLDAAQALVDAATEGPWAIWHDLDHQGFTTVGDADGVIREGEDHTVVCNPVAHVYVGPDAEFIAQARTLVPALIARVRDAEAKGRYADRRCIERGDELVKLRMELKAARATIARVQKVRATAFTPGDGWHCKAILAPELDRALEGEKS